MLFKTVSCVLMIDYVCERACVCEHHGKHVEVRGETVGVSFLFLPCGAQGLNSGCQVWHQVPRSLPAIGGPFSERKNWAGLGNRTGAYDSTALAAL